MSYLPYISVQPNYPEVANDLSSGTIPAERIWLSLYAANSPSGSIHSKLSLVSSFSSPAEGSFSISSVSGGEADGLSVQRVDRSLDLLVSTSVPSSTETRNARSLQPAVRVSPTHVRFPTRTVEKVLPQSSTAKVNDNYTAQTAIEAFDVSPTQNALYVAGGSDGALVVGTLADPQADGGADPEEEEALRGSRGQEHRIEALAAQRMRQREREKKIKLAGHVGDIRSARFFPSGEVLLTTSSDLTTRVFSALDGTNPRTLTGHKRAVLCSGIIERGREVLTGAGDGTVRLYDVGQGKQVGLFGVDRYSAVNAISVLPGGAQFVVALSSGSVQTFDVRTREPVALVAGSAFPPGDAPAASELWTYEATPAALTALDASADHMLTGSARGVLALHDARNTAHAVLTWKRNGAAISHVTLRDDGRAGLVATADGLPYRVDLGADEPRVTDEYAGWDTESTAALVTDYRGRVVVAGAESRIRRY